MGNKLSLNTRATQIANNRRMELPADPFVRAQVLEHLFFEASPDVGPEQITHVNTIVDSDGDLIIYMTTRRGERFGFIVVLKDNTNLTPLECQALASVYYLAERGDRFSASLAAEYAAKLKQRYGACEVKRAADGRVLILLQPRQVPRPDPSATDVIIRTGFSFDSSGDAIFAVRTRDANYIFDCGLQDHNGRLGLTIAELRALKILFEIAEPGDPMDAVRFTCVAGVLMNKFNQVQLGKSGTALVCRLKPTLVDRTEPLPDIVMQAMVVHQAEMQAKETAARSGALARCECPKGHALRRQSQASFSCTMCAKQMRSEAWSCTPCEFSACAACFERAKDHNGLSRDLCPKGHALREQQQRKYICDICRGSYQGSAMTCLPCDFDACRTCYRNAHGGAAGSFGTGRNDGGNAPGTSPHNSGSAGNVSASQYPGVAFSTDKPIGDGGQAQVYRGRYKGSDVAVKIFVTGDPDVYKAEVRALLRIGNHPNVVPVLEFFESPRPCLVMPFLSRGNLFEWLKLRTPSNLLTVSQVVLLGKQVAQGLSHIHEHDIVHRDMKSLNVMLKDDNTPVIIDLGLGKRNDSASTMRTVAVKGTLAWMAPEMLGDATWSKKTDVYAFGVIFWELLTCRQPFDHVTGDLAMYLLSQNGKLDHSRIADRPNWLQLIVSQCTSRTPSSRPDMSEVVRALEQGESGDPPSPSSSIFRKHAHEKGHLDFGNWSAVLMELSDNKLPLDKILPLFNAVGDGNSISWPQFLAFWAELESHGLDAAIATYCPPQAPYSGTSPAHPAAQPSRYCTTVELCIGCHAKPPSPSGRYCSRECRDAAHIRLQGSGSGQPPKSPLSGSPLTSVTGQSSSMSASPTKSMTGRSPPPPPPRATHVALYAYTAQQPDELTFPEGARLVIEQPAFGDSWVRGRYNGAEGMLPITYVEPI